MRSPVTVRTQTAVSPHTQTFFFDLLSQSSYIEKKKTRSLGKKENSPYKLDMNPVLPVNSTTSCRLLASAEEVVLSHGETNYTAYISMQLKPGTKPSAVKTGGPTGDKIPL